jgi:DNA-binding CsgD family transcriptional regulator
MEGRVRDAHAERVVMTTEDRTEALPDPIWRSVAGHIGKACAHLAVGRVDDARSAAETALHRAESFGVEPLVPVAECVLGLVAADSSGYSAETGTATPERPDSGRQAVDRRARCRPGRRGRRPRWGWESLTDAEHLVATTVAEGLTNSQAAARLLLSRHTVDFHLRQIYRKLDIASRVHLTRLVLEHSAEQADEGALSSGSR